MIEEKPTSVTRSLSRGFHHINVKLGVYGVLACAQVASVCGATDRYRGLMPEPFDIFNHVGNMGSMITAATAAIAGSIVSEQFTNDHRARRIGFALAMSVVTMGNFIAETKFCAPVATALDIGGTPDSIDLAYGLAAGAFGASTGLAVMDKIRSY